MSEDREQKYREYTERGRELLKYGSSEISEEDKKRAAIQLGLVYTPKKDVANAEALIAKLEESKKRIPQYIAPSH